MSAAADTTVAHGCRRIGTSAGDETMSIRSTDATARTGPRHVLTLQTSSVPMPVKLAAGLTFPGLAVFRSRTIEDGRERFRLHLGYFGSATDAAAVLVEVRPYYPSALVASEPAASSGSLDDTINTAFSLVRAAVARLVESDEVAPQSPPVAARHREAEATPSSPTLTPAEVASVMAPQRYAVQLDWSLKPINASAVPRLGIFRAYSLYAVSVLRQGSPEYGLRLGFYKNLEGARQVADYVRHAFPQASVVPVSFREYSRASGLARSDVDQARVPRSSSPATAATAEQRTHAETLARRGAHDLEADRERDVRVTLTAEERAMLTDRPPRNLRNG
jgi:hypothetical protein